MFIPENVLLGPIEFLPGDTPAGRTGRIWEAGGDQPGWSCISVITPKADVKKMLIKVDQCLKDKRPLSHGFSLGCWPVPVPWSSSARVALRE